MPKISNFKGKKCLVTGAGRGIGKAIASELHAQGAIVYALSKNTDNLKKLKQELPNVIPIPVDLANSEEVKKSVDSIETLDILINNAGICEPCKFLEISGESFDRVFNVNLKAAMIISQIVAKKMIERGVGGSILNISSLQGFRPEPTITTGIYPCTKAALNMLTKMMAVDFGPHKIRVNSLGPGLVLTDLTAPKNYPGEYGESKELGIQKVIQILKERTPTNDVVMPMKDIVNTALFLVSDQTSQLTGQCLTVDGGYLAH